MIAPKLINAMYPHIPNAKYAFDLFGGGGAMSFAFVKSGLITRYNELKSDMCVMYSYVLDCIKKPRTKQGLSELRTLSKCEQRELPKLSISNNDYLDFDFVKIAKELNATPDEILIYCDIPYQCSAEINAETYHNKFDINQFIEWTKKHKNSGFKIFLSELENPAPQVFREIYSTQKGEILEN